MQNGGTELFHPEPRDKAAGRDAHSPREQEFANFGILTAIITYNSTRNSKNLKNYILIHYYELYVCI